MSSTKADPSACPYTEVRTYPNPCICTTESQTGNYWDDEALRAQILQAQQNQQRAWWITKPVHALELWAPLLNDTFGLAGDGGVLPDQLDDTLPAHVVAAEIYNARYPLTSVIRYLRRSECMNECMDRPLWPVADCTVVVIDLVPGNQSQLVRQAFPERARTLNWLIWNSALKEEYQGDPPLKALVAYPFIRVFCTRGGDREHQNPSLDEVKELVTEMGRTDEASKSCRAFFLAKGSRVGVYTWDQSPIQAAAMQDPAALRLRVHPEQGDAPFLCLADDHVRVAKIVQQLSREVHAICKLAALW